MARFAFLHSFIIPKLALIFVTNPSQVPKILIMVSSAFHSLMTSFLSLHIR